jgi:hypothetical protein
MKKWLLIAVLGALSIALLDCGGGGKSKSVAPDWVGYMLAEINSHRPGNELIYDPAIGAVAAAHANFLNVGEYEAYYEAPGPAPLGPYAGTDDGTSVSRLANAGITYVSQIECGCWWNGTVQAAYSNLTNQSALTDSKYTHVGIGAAI